MKISDKNYSDLNKMKISLIDYNGKYPNNENLALRKIKAYYKNQGHTIDFNLKTPDKTFISVVFQDENFNHNNENNCLIGGPGFDVNLILPDEIEHTCPDYDGMDYSFGRTSWGCPRKCPFCITWRMEGIKTVEHSPFNEFVRHKKLLLFDANFLSSPNKIEKLETIKSNKWKVSFNQGLDVRLITPEIAELLAKIKTRDYKFNRNRIYIAWDLMKYSKQVIKGIETLINHGVKPYRLMCYVLTGFDTTITQDLLRCNTLIKYEIDPFVMVYNNRHDIPEIRHLSRYINKKYHKSDRKKYKNFNEYLRFKMRKSKYKKRNNHLLKIEQWNNLIRG